MPATYVPARNTILLALALAPRIRAIAAGTAIPDEAVREYADAIRDARACHVPIGKPVLRADDFLPDKSWGVLAAIGYMCDDPYTGAKGVTQLGEGVYRVTTRLATRNASSYITFTFRLMESFDQQRQLGTRRQAQAAGQVIGRVAVEFAIKLGRLDPELLQRPAAGDDRSIERELDAAPR